jgi:hypothetical protein
MEPQTPGERPYPVSFAVEYPDRDLNRLSTFFRIFAAIPILIVAGLLSGGGGTTTHWGEHTSQVAWGASGVVFLPTLLLLVFRRKYPRWWFDWNLELSRFLSRVGVYLALMDDRYPSTDERQSVTLDYDYPDAQNLNRWLPLVKWILAIPHYILLGVLSIAAFFVVIFAWFAILFTGRYPRSLFEFVEGLGRWYNRVIAYSITLVTDEYPPFRFSP